MISANASCTFSKPDLKKSGDVAQLGERGVRNAEVRGSIPLISTRDKKMGCFL